MCDMLTAQKHLSQAGVNPSRITTRVCKGLGHAMPKDDDSYKAMLEAFGEACTKRFMRANPDPLNMKSKWGVKDEYWNPDKELEPLPPLKAIPNASVECARRGPPAGWGEGTYAERMEWNKQNPYRAKLDVVSKARETRRRTPPHPYARRGRAAHAATMLTLRCACARRRSRRR